jgi:peptidylprolyl isomerase
MATNKQNPERQQKLQQHNQARVVAEATAAQAAQRRRLMIIAGSVVAVLLVATGAFALTRGSSSSPSNSEAASGTPVTTIKSAKTSALGDDCVARTGTLPAGSPEVYVPVGPPPTELQITDLATGSGAPVAADDTVTVNYTGVACSTGAVFDSSYASGQPVVFPLASVIKGWQAGLVGMLPGGRRLLVIPPDQAYGLSGNATIAPDETLVFVVDLVSTAPTPAGQPQTFTPGVSEIPVENVSVTPGGDTTTTTAPAGPKTCKPFADTLPTGAPGVPVPTDPVTSSLVKQDLVTGSGAPVAPGSTVTVQYIGVACSTGKIFDSSWANGSPATFGLNSVIKGWTDGLPGMHAGGRRLLVIPPDQAYGPQGTGGSIGPNETLIFVVDMISSK